MWFSLVWANDCDCMCICDSWTERPSEFGRGTTSRMNAESYQCCRCLLVLLLFSLIFRSFSAAYETYETAITRVWHYSWNEWYGARKRWRMKEYTLFERHKCMCACVSERAAIDWFSCTTAICMKWAIIHHQATSVMRDTHITILRQNDMSSFFSALYRLSFFSSVFTQKH